MNSKLSGPQLVQLKNSVVENFNASNWRELGALTNTLDQVENHDRLLRSLSWGDDDGGDGDTHQKGQYWGHPRKSPKKIISYIDSKLHYESTFVNKFMS